VVQILCSLSTSPTPLCSGQIIKNSISFLNQQTEMTMKNVVSLSAKINNFNFQKH